MTKSQNTYFKRNIGGERAMLMLPLNVIVIGRVRGDIDPAAVPLALERLRSRHPLLAVRVRIDDNGFGIFTDDNGPVIPVHTESRGSDDHWLERSKEELKMSFPIETGPLVRVSLVHSPEISEIILCGHHSVCDGMSLGYLLRDLLNCLAGTEANIGEPVDPPSIDRTTVPNPPSQNVLIRFVMSIINRKWATKKIRFHEPEMKRMHAEYWKRNDNIQIIAWEMSREATTNLVERCRKEHVTVNSVLWTAFLAAQHDVQDMRPRYHQRSALAVNNRDKLKVPAGEAFGFYASSLTVKLPYSPDNSFWENARTVHSKITKELMGTNLFRMLSADLIHPTILDALYFQKYGFLDERIPKKMLRKMGWHDLTYGYAITNVGRFDIPTTYGSYRLEAVHGPLFYSDVEEKMLGVITVGGRLSFILGCNETIVGDAGQIKDTAMSHLEQAIEIPI